MTTYRNISERWGERAERVPAMTSDGLTVYDMDPQSAELWAVAGPAGYDVSTIDTDNLPDGFRWVTEEEWEELQAVSKNTVRTVTIRNNFHNTECTLRATDNKLTPSQVKRCRKTLCGFHDCTCAEGPLGERGPQDVIYSYTMDNNGGYHVELDREEA